MRRPTRIVVLGQSLALSGVTSASWADVPTIRSLDNFDVVVVDATTVEPAHFASLNGRSAQAHRFLYGPRRDDAEMIVVGWHAQVQHLLPVTPNMFDLDGTDFDLAEDVLTDDLRRWFSQVRKYEHAFSGWLNKGEKLVSDVTPFARTPTGMHVGASYEARKGDEWSLPIVLLPAATESPTEALEQLLVSRYGLLPQEPVPDWMQSVEPLPSHAQAIADVDRLDAEIAALSQELSSVRTTEQREREYQALLYQQDDPLDLLVRRCLRELGASVLDPLTKGEEDGRVEAPTGQRAALEVKGKKGPIGRGDVRQLDEWVENVERENPGQQWTGLMVSNAHRLTPPAERGDPFASNAKKLLASLGYSHITTIELYEAIRSVQLGTFDEMAWWASVFAS